MSNPVGSSTGVGIWEWLSDVAWSREIVRLYPVPANGTTYQNPVDQDLKAPLQTVSLQAFGLTASQVNTLETAANGRGVTYSFVDQSARTWTGEVMSLSYKSIKGTNLFGPVVVQIRY